MPESAGIYFSWGNTEGHPYGAGYDFSQEVYNATPAAAISTNLSLAQDAARAVLGSPWRMPSAAEFQELFDNCTSVWTTLNGKRGRLLTSNVNGKTLFLPATGIFNGTTLYDRDSRGNYWSSSYNSTTEAYRLAFSSSNTDPQSINDRRYGFAVRAVREA